MDDIKKPEPPAEDSEVKTSETPAPDVPEKVEPASEPATTSASEAQEETGSAPDAVSEQPEAPAGGSPPPSDNSVPEMPVKSEPTATPSAVDKKAAAPIAAIMAAFIAIILCGLTVVAYRANQNQSHIGGQAEEVGDSNQSNNNDEQPNISPADEQSATELDTQLDNLEQELDDIDEQLEADSLEDTSLGL